MHFEMIHLPHQSLGKKKSSKIKRYNSNSIFWYQYELISLTLLISLKNKKV